MAGRAAADASEEDKANPTYADPAAGDLQESGYMDVGLSDFVEPDEVATA